MNDLIHSVRGDEFLGGNVSLTAHGSVGAPDDSHQGGSDSSASQVFTNLPLPLEKKGVQILSFKYQLQIPFVSFKLLKKQR